MQIAIRPPVFQPPALPSASDARAAVSAHPGAHEGASGAGKGQARLREMAQGPGLAAHLSGSPDGRDGIRNGNGGQAPGSSSGKTSHTLTSADMDRILHAYQVEDDTMREGGWQLSGWKRDVAEALGISIPDPIQATETEARLLDGLGLSGMKAFRDNANLATEEVRKRYGDANGNDPHPGKAPFNDDHADAFRHAYVNALTARDMGQGWATDYWTAHERIPGNDAAREAMDLYNNEVGRRIAAEHPFASDEELADLVQQAVANGEMVVIDKNGRLVPSNSIEPKDAGHPTDNAPPLPGHPQDMQTSQ